LLYAQELGLQATIFDI
ncbi:TPA: DUF3269 family protein, partial [Staphylococcus aureus]|nr:DUF3269 family protein [Staphylococcus aureus]